MTRGLILLWTWVALALSPVAQAQPGAGGPAAGAPDQAAVDRAWDAFAEALALARSGQRAAAVRNLEQGLAVLPNEVRLQSLLASLLELEGRRDEAVQRWRMVDALADNAADRADAAAALARLSAAVAPHSTRELFSPPFSLPTFSADELARRKLRYRRLMDQGQLATRFDKVESGVRASQDDARADADTLFARYQALARHLGLQLSVEMDYIKADLGTRCAPVPTKPAEAAGWRCKRVFQHTLFRATADELPDALDALRDDDPAVRALAAAAKQANDALETRGQRSRK